MATRAMRTLRLRAATSLATDSHSGRRLSAGRFVKGGRLTPWGAAASAQPGNLADATGPIVPLISSSTPGPLGLSHVPRMWLQSLLTATLRLDATAVQSCDVFDDVVTAAVGIEISELRAFLATPPLPTYLEMENWIRAHARRLSPDTIEQANNAVRKAAQDGQSLVMLSDLYAWSSLHRSIVQPKNSMNDPVIPMISSRTCGPAGIDHLPRLWVKNILKASGALPIGYRAGRVRMVRRGLAITPGGLDAQTYERFGVDMNESVAFLDRDRPDYPTFEAWFVRHATRLDPATFARHNAVCNDTRSAKARVEVAYARYDGPSRWDYLVDDLIDWQLMHDVATKAQLPPWTK
jgi:hypothetical protein